MKVRITDIGPSGLKVSDNIALEPLNRRMNEAKSNEFIFTEAPHVELHVHKTPSGAQVKGTARAKYNQPCSLCAKELDREAIAEINMVFQRRTPLQLSNLPEEDDSFSDDIGLSYFYGEHIELEDIIQESLILTLDPYYRPPQNEAGECTSCGKSCRFGEVS